MTLMNVELGDIPDPKVAPMTKARAGEIMYESLKHSLVTGGGISPEDELLVLRDFGKMFDAVGIPRKETLEFIAFLKKDVIESLKKQETPRNQEIVTGHFVSRQL